MTSPYAWDPHLVTWSILILAAALVVGGHRRLSRTVERPIPWTRHQIVLFAGAFAASVVALTWPMADLAAHWSLTALVTQRLVLLLAVAPMLLLGLPYDLIQWLTRPAALDAVLNRLQRPPLAVATVTVLVVGSMTPALVRAQATSPLARGGLDALIVVAGLVLWIPVLGRIPGILRLKPVVRFGYLVIQAVVPAFLSFIYIFAVHPLYPTFARSHAAIGMRPLNDQQIAGFVSKLSMLLILLSVGAVVLARASTSDAELGDNDPLVWADVEREFERADRRSSKVVTGSSTGPSVPPGSDPADGIDPGRASGPGSATGHDFTDHRSGSVDPPDTDPPDTP
ncbi:MAG: cytochrome c oxidase assembly protein [Acidimicrobiales bacterium]|nr:cytochrome c oxidase assembly protein [Acidimicrobiales bacterium]